MKSPRFVFFIASIVFAFSGVAVNAFTPHEIISEKELTEYQSMNEREIQEFLSSQGSGISRSASAIIAQASAQYRISPKILLALLQKEQSLVTDPSPSLRQKDWATGYGVCDGCRLGDPDVARYRGFETQVFSAAGLLRDILEHPPKY